MDDDQRQPLAGGIVLSHQPEMYLPSHVLYRDAQALAQGCTDLLEHRAWLQWERQGLLEQRNLLLEQRIGLLNQLEQQKKLIQQ